MNADNAVVPLVGSVCVILITLVVGIGVIAHMRLARLESLQDEAVKHGYAEFVVVNREVQFQWKEIK